MLVSPQKSTETRHIRKCTHDVLDVSDVRSRVLVGEGIRYGPLVAKPTKCNCISLRYSLKS